MGADHKKSIKAMSLGERERDGGKVGEMDGEEEKGERWRRCREEGGEWKRGYGGESDWERWNVRGQGLEKER